MFLSNLTFIPERVNTSVNPIIRTIISEFIWVSCLSNILALAWFTRNVASKLATSLFRVCWGGGTSKREKKNPTSKWNVLSKPCGCVGAQHSIGCAQLSWCCCPFASSHSQNSMAWGRVPAQHSGKLEGMLTKRHIGTGRLSGGSSKSNPKK